MSAPRYRRVLHGDSPIESSVEAICAALVGVETPRIAVSGGSAAGLIAPLRVALGARWSQGRLTWADERCVPFASPASNRGESYRSEGLRSAHPPRQELALFHEGEHPAAAAARASQSFEEDFGGLDVAILGMGADGHIASHFPGLSVLGTGVVQVVSESPKPPKDRLTLALPVLAAAGLSLIYACGEGKRPALESLLAGDESAPATALHNLVVVTDLQGLSTLPT